MSLPSLENLLTNNSAFSERDARLALELASGMSEVSEILKRFDMTEEELRERLQNDSFKQLVRETKSVWNSDLNVKERVRLKSALLLEDSLLSIFKLIHDDKAGAGSKMNAFNSLARIASVEEPKEAKGGGAGKFTLNITVPGGEKPVVIEGESGKEDDKDGFGDEV